MAWVREIAHLYNDEAEGWLGKYIKYKGHQEARTTALLQRHFPLSNIAGYNLAQDKIILRRMQPYSRFPTAVETWLNCKPDQCSGGFIELLLSAFYTKPNIILWIQVLEFTKIQFMYVFITEIWVTILGNSLKLIDVPYFTLNSLSWIQNIEFSKSPWFSVMNSYYEFMYLKSHLWIQIKYYEFIYIWIHIVMNSSINSKTVNLNSYIWIRVLMNSYDHFIYEFILSPWIHIVISDMNSYV